LRLSANAGWLHPLTDKLCDAIGFVESGNNNPNERLIMSGFYQKSPLQRQLERPLVDRRPLIQQPADGRGGFKSDNQVFAEQYILKTWGSLNANKKESK